MLTTTGLPHICSTLSKPRDPADLQDRSKSFYQNCRNSGVHYNAVSLKGKNALFSTLPKKRADRHDGIFTRKAKKAIVRTGTLREEKVLETFPSKRYLSPVKHGQYVPELEQRQDTYLNDRSIQYDE